MSGCGVEIDGKSQQDEDGLSEFIQHLSGIVSTISNHNHTGKEHDTKMTSNFSNSRADLSGFSVQSLVNYSKINTEDQSISSSHCYHLLFLLL